MGSNGSYVKAIGGVPENNRSHIDTNMKIDGHKVLLQKNNRGQAKNILYSNSDSPIYIIGHQHEDGTVEIHSINICKGHQLSIEVNIKYDSKGNVLKYNGKESGTHCHYWEEKSTGDMGRKSSSSKHEAVPKEYESLLDSIARFNKERRVYNG